VPPRERHARDEEALRSWWSKINALEGSDDDEARSLAEQDRAIDAREERVCDMIASRLSSFLKPQSFVVRVYVLSARGLLPADTNGSADPFVVARIGNQTVGKSAWRLNDTLEPDFLRCLELQVTLPGATVLRVEVRDWDLLSPLVNASHGELMGEYAHRAARAVCLPPSAHAAGLKRARGAGRAHALRHSCTEPSDGVQPCNCASRESRCNCDCPSPAWLPLPVASLATAPHRARVRVPGCVCCSRGSCRCRRCFCLPSAVRFSPAAALPWLLSRSLPPLLLLSAPLRAPAGLRSTLNGASWTASGSPSTGFVPSNGGRSRKPTRAHGLLQRDGPRSARLDR
jgi:hypothetical protein